MKFANGLVVNEANVLVYEESTALVILAVAFTSKRQDQELDTRNGKQTAAMQALHYLVAMIRELRKKNKALNFSKQFLFLFSLMVINLG